MLPQAIDASLPLSTPSTVFVTNLESNFVCEGTNLIAAEYRVICLHYSLRIPTLRPSWHKHTLINPRSIYFT